MRKNCTGWALSGLMLLTLAGCGGSGGISAAGGGAPAGITVNGVAATGAAFTDAVITVIDSRGITVGQSQPVGADGTYSITLDAAAVAPFVLVATRTDANGATQSLVSVIASAGVTTANITSITTLIASRLSPSGDPTKLAGELAAGSAIINPQVVADTVVEVQAILASLLTASNTSGINPLTGTFSTDGTGYDRLLDSVNITFLPASTTTTNIEISVKQEVAEGEQPTSLSFSSVASTVAPLPAIDPTTLVAEGTSVKITNFLNALTACYALPVESRVTGTATVVASECLDVFHGNNPALFKNGGSSVSSTGAFASLFNAGSVGASFSQGTYEFTRANPEKDVVVGYKSRGTDGNEQYDTFVLRTGVDGKLRLIGNQYRFPGRVAAYQQRRNFITLDQQEYSYFSTGYVLDVPNRQRPSGLGPLFNRVVVTTPTGAVLTLQPSGAASFLGLVKAGPVVTGTSFVRLRSEYVDGSTTRAHPRSVDTTLFFVPDPDRTEASLAAAKSQGSWKFEYYLSYDDLATPQDDTVVPEVQYYKNRARALTIAELRTQGLAELKPDLISEIQSGTEPLGAPAAGQIVFVAGDTADISTAAGGDGWSVAAGQLPPTQITVFGRSPTNVNFTDSVDVRSVARKTALPCSVQSMTDDHCSGGGPGYAAGSRLTGLHLFARDAEGRDYANFYALYQLATP